MLLFLLLSIIVAVICCFVLLISVYINFGKLLACSVAYKTAWNSFTLLNKEYYYSDSIWFCIVLITVQNHQINMWIRWILDTQTTILCCSILCIHIIHFMSNRNSLHSHHTWTMLKICFIDVNVVVYFSFHIFFVNLFISKTKQKRKNSE